MADTGFKRPTSSSQIQGYQYATGWNNPALAYDTDSTTYASSYCPEAGLGSGGTPIYLGRGFGFSIPTNATINGVEVYANVKSGAALYCLAGLYNGTTLLGSEKQISAPNPSSYETFGGAADVWGATVTPAIVNSSVFSVGINYEGAGVSGNSDIRDIQVKIYYTIAATGTSLYVPSQWF